jgi:hypothetical protein
MNHTIGIMKKGLLSELVSLESNVTRPPENIIQKIQNLTGLLDSQSVPNWRTLDKKIDIYQSRNNYINKQIRLEVESRERDDYIKRSSFQSLPSLHNSSLSSRKNYSDGNLQHVSHVSHVSHAPRSGVKYVSKYKSSETQVEDKILNTIILSKLNKFSESTYNDIRDFLYQVLGSSDGSVDLDFLKEFVQLVFKKATSEEIFCPLYAKLLGEASAKYPIVLKEMDKLHENYMNIFHDNVDVDTDADYDKFVASNIEKKYRLGYSQFLSELTLLHILPVEKLVAIFEIITKQIVIQGMILNKNTLNEEYIDCLLRITKVLKGRQEPFFIHIRKTLLSSVNDSIEEIQNNKEIFVSISTKARFLLLNIKDYLQ